jgi:hypothetical protein
MLGDRTIFIIAAVVKPGRAAVVVQFAKSLTTKATKVHEGNI